ncbi:MAG: hypothetical protein ABI664_20135 [bacterium]
MRPPIRVALLAAVFMTLAVPTAAHARQEQKPKTKKTDSTRVKAPKVDTTPAPLFTSEALLPVTFTTNVRQLRGDRKDDAPYRSATLSYVAADGKTVTVPVRTKTHGIWRLKNCEFPPIRLNVANKDAKGTLFHDLQKPKMVNVCKDRDNYEQLVLQELQLYRIYQVVTPISHKVRALRVTYADSGSDKVIATRYGFVFEDPDEMADRLGGKVMKVKGAGPDDIDPQRLAVAYLFEYLIANTDFSFNGLHNGELIAKPDGTPLLPVAYDFDFSGAVNAPYATVDPRLTVKRVRDRLFRGYCVLKPEMPAAVALFKQKKDAIYALYRDDVGKLLDEKVVRETLEFFDDFYRTIGNERDLANMLGTCVGPR